MNTQPSPEQIGSLLGEIRAVAEALPRFDPEFAFEIEWQPSYDDLFARRGTGGTSGVDRLLDEALIHGRLMLSAEGGHGKTSIIRRLFRLGEAAGMWPVLLDMRKWSPAIADKWRATAGRVAQVELLLSELAEPQASEGKLFEVPDGRQRVVLVDGINEIDASAAQKLLAALDDFAARNPLACVVVTDRLVRRDIRPERWALATIAPLSDTEIAQHVGHNTGTNELLKTAFFLDIATHERVDSSSGAAAIRHYMDHHSGLDEGGMIRAAEAGFGVYAHLAATHELSRTFHRSMFETIASTRVTDLLTESGLLVESDGLAYFRHHLFHDYLASLWLTHDPGLWDHASFDAITFRASSFDALAMALEQLVDPVRADLLVTRIYDWNFYAVSYALWKAQSQGVSAVTNDTKSVLLTLLAEKNWDPVHATKQRVTDGLRLFREPIIERLLLSPSLGEFVGMVRDDPTIGQNRPDWRAVFTTAPGQVAPDALVERITEPESLIGWTVANVLRRVRLNSLQQGRLRGLAVEGSDAVRWRIAHVFGAHPSAENIEVLFQRLDDDGEYQWVRYGSIRSLVESASRSKELRDSIVERIVERLPRLIQDRPVLAELEKAVLLTDPPDDWAEGIGPVIDELWAMAPTIETQERWLKLGHEVQRGRE